MIPTPPPPFDLTVTINSAHIRRAVRRSLAAAGIKLAPTHRADVLVDSCPFDRSRVCDLPGHDGGRHAAARVAEDERRAL